MWQIGGHGRAPAGSRFTERRPGRPRAIPDGRAGCPLKIPCMTVLTATLTCPHCGQKKTETMPTNACVHFYECSGCRTVLRPKPGDCWHLLLLWVEPMPTPAKRRRVTRLRTPVGGWRRRATERADPLYAHQGADGIHSL